MIKTIDQDILEIKSGVIAHFCNCLGYMGGLAGAINRRFPVVGREYKELVNINKNHAYNLLGTTQIVRIDKSDLYVANMFTQYDIGEGRKTEYCAVRHAASMLKKLAIGSHTVYFPHGVGAGLGGGDRSIIESILDKEFSFYDGDVVFCRKL